VEGFCEFPNAVLTVREKKVRPKYDAFPSWPIYFDIDAVLEMHGMKPYLASG